MHRLVTNSLLPCLILLLWLAPICPASAEDDSTDCSAEAVAEDMPLLVAAPKPKDPLKNFCPEATNQPASNYPWKRNIMTTTFWIGQGSSGYNSMTNYKSAWDTRWTKNYGGTDDPREAKRSGLVPRKFAPKLNPFYVALPFNDIKYPKLSKKYVPWWDEEKFKESRWTSQCKGRWVKIRFTDKQGKVKYCYAQWEDVGPFRYDHVRYVFGDERPQIHSKAGLDVSPAVATYLGLDGLDPTDWKFVEHYEVPPGPWLKYGEHAILYAAIAENSKKR